MLLTLGFGIAKVQMLRAYPPDYAKNGFNSYEGFVSGDGFSHRSALVRDWLLGDDEGATELRAYLSDGGHPNSILVPTLVGATAILTKSIPWTFVGWSCLASVAQALLIVSIARSLLPGSREREGPRSAAPWVLGSVFLGHCLAIRTAGQLHLDPFCSVAMLATVALSLRLAQRRNGATGAVLFLVQCLGLFTKASYLPALAIPFVIMKLKGQSWLRCFVAMLVFGVFPLAVMLTFVEFVPGRDTAGRDFGQFLAAWHLSPRELRHFAVEMLLLFQFWPIVLIARRRRVGSGTPILMCALLVLVSTWVFKLPAVPRLYLPVLGLGLAGCAGVVSDLLHHRFAFPAFVAVLLANYGVAVWGTFGFML